MGVILVVVLIVAAIYLCIRFIRHKKAEVLEKQIRAAKQIAEHRRHEAAQKEEALIRKDEFLK